MKIILRVAVMSIVLVTAISSFAGVRINVKFGAPFLHHPAYAPYPGAIWVPGHYQYVGFRYVWMPGYWRRPPLYVAPPRPIPPPYFHPRRFERWEEHRQWKREHDRDDPPRGHARIR